MILEFIYIDCEKSLDKEKIISNTCNQACKFLKLPDKLEIEIQNFSAANYQRDNRYVLAETVLDYRLTTNRLRLNNDLSIKELIIPLVHELIHINQIAEGRLSVYRNGDIFWQGKRYQLKDPKKSSYQYYANLPWEIDVKDREKKLLENILKELE